MLNNTIIKAYDIRTFDTTHRCKGRTKSAQPAENCLRNSSFNQKLGMHGFY